MPSVSKITGPACDRCEQHMLWQNEQIVDGCPMQIFYCPSCDRLAAAADVPAKGREPVIAASLRQ
jgi:hypothetical protein